MTTIYYRRTNRPHAFPVTRMDDVEVTTEPQVIGPADADWQKADIDPECVSISGGLSEPWLLADAYMIEAAIMRFLGIDLPVNDAGFGEWTPGALDNSGESGHEALCDAVEAIYGYDVANRQRAMLASRLSENYLASHSIEF